jgi:hypothetical protein
MARAACQGVRRQPGLMVLVYYGHRRARLSYKVRTPLKLQATEGCRLWWHQHSQERSRRVRWRLKVRCHLHCSKDVARFVKAQLPSKPIVSCAARVWRMIRRYNPLSVRYRTMATVTEANDVHY